MTNGIWVSPTKFVEFSKATAERDRLLEDIATRQNAWDWTGFMGLLPDPDPVLRKLEHGGAEILEGLTADGHLIGIIQQRKLGTLKKEFRFEPGLAAGEKTASAQATKLRDDFIANLENVDLYNLLSQLLDAPFYGNTPVEIKWKPNSSRLAIRDLEAKPTWWFGYNEQNDPRFMSVSNPWDGLELPFGKFAFCRHFPTYINPFGLRLLSRCLWPCAIKKGGIKFAMILAEKFGIPFLIGKHRPGATPAEKQEMLSNLSRMVRDAVAVIAQGGAVEVIETGKGGSQGSIHLDLVHEMNAEMSKVIMLQTLTAEVSDKGGSRAQGQVHQEVLDVAQNADAVLVKKTMEEIAWIYGQVNAPGVPTPKFVWFEEADPKKEFAERDKTLTEGGVVFKKSHYVKTYGFDEADFEVETPKPGKGDQGLGDSKSGNGVVTEFAAGDSYPDQAALDAALSAMTPGQMQGPMVPLLKPAINIWQQTNDPDKVMEVLLAIWPQISTDQLQELLTRIIFVSECWGRLNASEE